jgi:hypothetical protein
MHSSEALVTTYKMTQHHNPQMCILFWWEGAVCWEFISSTFKGNTNQAGNFLHLIAVLKQMYVSGQ